MSRPSGHAPLVWFTSLAIAGAGLVVAAAWRPPGFTSVQANALVDGALLLSVGIAISTLHLGRWWRAPLAVRGIGRSPLSGEVVLASAVLASCLLLWTEYRHGRVEIIGRAAAAIVSIAFLVSIGLVYRLGGQRTWRGAATLLPLTAGLVFGEVYLSAAGGGFDAAPIVPICIVGADAAVYLIRWWGIARVSERGRTGARARWTVNGATAVRLILFDVAPLARLALGAADPARVAVMVGLAFDRFTFYALANQHTTEAEITRVEGIIQRGA